MIFLLFNVVLNFRNKKWKSECMCWQPCSPPCTNLWHQMLLRTKRNLRERHQNVGWVSNQAALSPVSQLALTSVRTPIVTCTTWTMAAPWWVPCRLQMCWSCVQGVERIVQVWVDELSVMDLSYSALRNSGVTVRCYRQTRKKRAHGMFCYPNWKKYIMGTFTTKNLKIQHLALPHLPVCLRVTTWELLNGCSWSFVNL
jgi:hypothetical protein